MRAQEITLLKLVQGDKQFQVPLYQRTYSRGGEQLQRLREDIGELVEQHLAGEPAAPHFLGSVVLGPGQIQAGGVQRWLVVDGQQWLTTLMPAFTALRDHLKETGDARGVDRVHRQVLVNEFHEGADHYRLPPTQADRDAYTACVQSRADAGGGDNVGAAYRYGVDVRISPDGRKALAHIGGYHIVDLPQRSAVLSPGMDGSYISYDIDCYGWVDEVRVRCGPDGSTDDRERQNSFWTLDTSGLAGVDEVPDSTMGEPIIPATDRENTVQAISPDGKQMIFASLQGTRLTYYRSSTAPGASPKKISEPGAEEALSAGYVLEWRQVRVPAGSSRRVEAGVAFIWIVSRRPTPVSSAGWGWRLGRPQVQ
jgi:hypothetical protein